VDVAGYKIINVYKPPRSRHTPTTIPTFPQPSLYVGDFNSQLVNWGYNTTSPDGESLDSRDLPPLDTPDIDRAYQDFCESLLSAAKQCISLGRRKNYVPCWDKECETLYRSFIRAPVGTASEPPRPYSIDYNRRSRSDGRKLSTPSTSRTLATRRVEQSTNILAGLDALLACAPSQQIPSPRNS